MSTIDFPLERLGVSRAEMDLRRLTRLLRESALLLEAASASSDTQFRTGSVDLAIRTMRAASAAIERSGEPESGGRPARAAAVVRGPWQGSVEPALDANLPLESL